MTTDDLLGSWPYVALVVACGVWVIRFALAGRRTAALGNDITEARAVFAGTRIWSVSACLLLATHVLLLAAPRAVLAWNAAPLRLYLLEGSGFLLGAVALGAWADAMWRHLTRRSTSATTSRTSARTPGKSTARSSTS